MLSSHNRANLLNHVAKRAAAPAVSIDELAALVVQESIQKTEPRNKTHPSYLNWGFAEHRERLLRGEVPAGESLLLLDELHKFARWRSLVKGLYDTRKSKQSVLVIGSARLDY